MYEDTLKEFFLGRIAAPRLSDEAPGSIVQDGPLVVLHHVRPIEDGFVLRAEHLIRLCDAVIGGAMEPRDLGTIAGLLIASDTFEYDAEGPVRGMVGSTLLEWSAPPEGRPLTVDEVQRTRDLLAAWSVAAGRGVSQFA
jgi:hypothetical protein